jgi:CheY-like chemotaxis protein
MVSVVAEKKSIERCLAAGANAYLTKPFATKELVETVARLLGTPRD